MITIDILLVLIIIISIIMVLEKNNLNLIIYSSVFSLIAASIYYRYKSPDLALAEVAIGSAIIPLIFIIAIGKQRKFVVVTQVEEDFFQLKRGVESGRGFDLLNSFCKDHDLKLKVFHSFKDKKLGAFDRKNIDIIVLKCPSTQKYILKGNINSILIKSLKKITENIDDIEVIQIEDQERMV